MWNVRKRNGLWRKVKIMTSSLNNHHYNHWFNLNVLIICEIILYRHSHSSWQKQTVLGIQNEGKKQEEDVSEPFDTINEHFWKCTTVPFQLYNVSNETIDFYLIKHVPTLCVILYRITNDERHRRHTHANHSFRFSTLRLCMCVCMRLSFICLNNNTETATAWNRR